MSIIVIAIFCRTIPLWLLFLLFRRMERSKNKLLSLKTTRVLLSLRVRLRVLTNLRLPLKKKSSLMPASQRNPFLLLFPQGTKGKGLKPSILVPPRLPKKLLLLKRG
jgi:hypothetical protein